MDMRRGFGGGSEGIGLRLSRSAACEDMGARCGSTSDPSNRTRIALRSKAPWSLGFKKGPGVRSLIQDQIQDRHAMRERSMQLGITHIARVVHPLQADRGFGELLCVDIGLGGGTRQIDVGADLPADIHKPLGRRAARLDIAGRNDFSADAEFPAEGFKKQDIDGGEIFETSRELEAMFQLLRIFPEERRPGIGLGDAAPMLVCKRTRDTHVVDRSDPFVAPRHRHRQPFQAVLGLDQIAVMPVILAVFDVVIDDEDVDHRNDVEIALPRDIARLQNRSAAVLAWREVAHQHRFVINIVWPKKRSAGLGIIPSPVTNYQLFPARHLPCCG